jgi:hypothetical protein
LCHHPVSFGPLKKKETKRREKKSKAIGKLFIYFMIFGFLAEKQQSFGWPEAPNQDAN